MFKSVLSQGDSGPSFVKRTEGKRLPTYSRLLQEMSKGFKNETRFFIKVNKSSQLQLTVVSKLITDRHLPGAN